jgi:hypothetical protein
MSWKDRLSDWLWRANDSRAARSMEKVTETLSYGYSPDQPNVTGGNAVAKRLADQDLARDESTDKNSTD